MFSFEQESNQLVKILSRERGKVGDLRITEEGIIVSHLTDWQPLVNIKTDISRLPPESTLFIKLIN